MPRGRTVRHLRYTVVLLASCASLLQGDPTAFTPGTRLPRSHADADAGGWPRRIGPFELVRWDRSAATGLFVLGGVVYEEKWRLTELVGLRDRCEQSSRSVANGSIS